jgi:hypothetical protein
MSTNDKTGGRVFPMMPGGDSAATHRNGITMRQWYAGKAMAAMVSSIDGEANYQRMKAVAATYNKTVSQWIAMNCFAQADAMIAFEAGEDRAGDGVLVELLSRARDRLDEMERNSGCDYELDSTPEEETLLGRIEATLKGRERRHDA